MESDATPGPIEGGLTFKEHLKKLLGVIKVNLFVFMGLLVVNIWTAQMVLRWLSEKYTIAALKPSEAIASIVTLDITLSLLALFPFALITIFNYTSPAIENKAKLWFVMLVSLNLFIAGGVFGFFVYNGLVLSYLNTLALSSGLINVWSASNLVSFMTTNVLMFAFTFQIPLVVIVLVNYKLVKPKMLAKGALFAIPFVMLGAAWITPPDPVSMLLLSGPIIGLYYSGIGISMLMEKGGEE